MLKYAIQAAAHTVSLINIEAGRKYATNCKFKSRKANFQFVLVYVCQTMWHHCAFFATATAFVQLAKLVIQLWSSHF